MRDSQKCEGQVGLGAKVETAPPGGHVEENHDRIHESAYLERCENDHYKKRKLQTIVVVVARTWFIPVPLIRRDRPSSFAARWRTYVA